jgi:hypothetical protein
MSITATAYTKTRSELATLFGWNAGALSPEQMLRLDCATALRLALDELQGRLIRGDGRERSPEPPFAACSCPHRRQSAARTRGKPCSI